MGVFSLKRIQNESTTLDRSRRKTISGSVSIGCQDHAYMETHSAIVIPQGEKQEFVCYYTTQDPSNVQTSLSRLLEVPKHKVIVKAKRIGGAFGGKERMQTALVNCFVFTTD